MEIEVVQKGAFSLGLLKLAGAEQAQVDGGAMMSMTAGVTIETKATGGFMKSLARSMLAGESFFQNTYSAPAGGGEVTVAPALPGDMAVLQLVGEPFMIQSGAYIASEVGVQLDTKWGGAKTFFASKDLVMLRSSGTGKVVIATYGGMLERDLAAGETLTVDTGFLVAFKEGMNLRIRKVGGLKSFFLSGEGLVADVTGPGHLIMQTRSTSAFLSWLIPQLPKSNGN